MAAGQKVRPLVVSVKIVAHNEVPLEALMQLSGSLQKISWGYLPARMRYLEIIRLSKVSGAPFFLNSMCKCGPPDAHS